MVFASRQSLWRGSGEVGPCRRGKNYLAKKPELLGFSMLLPQVYVPARAQEPSAFEGLLPHNGWALFGLVQLCLNSTSSASHCAQLESKFNRSWHHADAARHFRRSGPLLVSWQLCVRSNVAQVVLSDPADVCILPARASDTALSLSKATRPVWVAVAAGVILASVGCFAGNCRLASIPCSSCAYHRFPDEESALPHAS